MSIIKNHLQIELSIDQILYRLRLLRLNELQSQQKLNGAASVTTTTNKPHKNRPGLESRSASQLNVVLRPMMSMIDEGEEKPRKRTETTKQDTTNFTVTSSQSTPMVVALSDNLQIVHGSKKKDQKQQQKEIRRERSSTKRGLLMTKPE